MTGADQIELSRRALDWAWADRMRRDHLLIVHLAEKVAKKKRASKRSKLAAEFERQHHRELAARAAGYRRGLVTACERVIAKGVDVPRSRQPGDGGAL